MGGHTGQWTDEGTDRLPEEWKRNYTGKLRRMGGRKRSVGPERETVTQDRQLGKKENSKAYRQVVRQATEEQQEASQPDRFMDRQRDRQWPGCFPPPLLAPEADPATGLNFQFLASTAWPWRQARHLQGVFPQGKSQLLPLLTLSLPVDPVAFPEAQRHLEAPHACALGNVKLADPGRTEAQDSWKLTTFSERVAPNSSGSWCLLHGGTPFPSPTPPDGQQVSLATHTQYSDGAESGPKQSLLAILPLPGTASSIQTSVW